MTSKHSKTPASLTAGNAGAPLGDGGAASAEQAGHAVRQGVAASLSAIETIEAQIATLARSTIADTLGIGGGAATGLTTLVEHVVRGALAASEQVGTGLTLSVRGVAKGIIEGVHDVGGDVVLAAFDTARALIVVSAALGADLGIVARQAIGGILDAVDETGGDAGRIGTRAAEGAITAAGGISQIAIATVRDVLVGIAGDATRTAGTARPQSGPHERAGAATSHH